MTDDPTPPRPALVAEHRVVLTLPSGAIVVRVVDSKAEAHALAQRVRHGSATIERRLVTAWAPIGPRGAAVQPTEGR